MYPVRQSWTCSAESGRAQSPGAERLDDSRYRNVLYAYVTSVISQFRNDPRVLAWDLWNEPDNPAKVYRKVERADKIEVVGELLPQVFQWARDVQPVQPLTSAVWQGAWTPGKRSAIADIQLGNSDVVSFHNYGKPADFEARIDELSSIGRPILCTEYLARSLGNTVESTLPIMKRHNVAAYNWGLVAGRTQTYFPWDSWDEPYDSVPDVWFSDLVRPDGRAYRPDEVAAFRQFATPA